MFNIKSFVMMKVEYHRKKTVLFSFKVLITFTKTGLFSYKVLITLTKTTLTTPKCNVLTKVHVLLKTHSTVGWSRVLDSCPPGRNSGVWISIIVWLHHGVREVGRSYRFGVRVSSSTTVQLIAVEMKSESLWQTAYQIVRLACCVWTCLHQIYLKTLPSILSNPTWEYRLNKNFTRALKLLK